MNNIDNYNSLLNIAKSAYGSGVFEGSKGGNGYLGQYTDAQGVAHTVKVLTHRSERTAYVSSDDRKSTDALAEATENLKEQLIRLAGGADTKLGGKIKKMLEDAQTKAVAEKMTVGSKGKEVGLLSRKIVAQAVTAIANETKVVDGNGHKFSWDDVNGENRARTENDTTVETVNGALTEKRAKAGEMQVDGELDASKKKFDKPPQNNQVQSKIDKLPQKKVSQTPLQLACVNYIKFLGEMRDSLLNAIKNAGFSSPRDEWILNGLRDHYDNAIQNATVIQNCDNTSTIRALFGSKFLYNQDIPSDDDIKATLFDDSKNVLSKTLCSLALLSEYDFDEDENNQEEYSNKLAGILEDAFKLSDLGDFTAKLDRVKALVRPEGKNAACVRTLFVNDIVDLTDGKVVNGRPNPFEKEADRELVYNNSSFAKFVGSKEFKTGLSAYLRGDKVKGGEALDRDAIRNAIFDYAVHVFTAKGLYISLVKDQMIYFLNDSGQLPWLTLESSLNSDIDPLGEGGFVETLKHLCPDIEYTDTKNWREKKFLFVMFDALKKSYAKKLEEELRQKIDAQEVTEDDLVELCKKAHQNKNSKHLVHHEDEEDFLVRLIDDERRTELLKASWNDFKDCATVSDYRNQMKKLGMNLEYHLNEQEWQTVWEIAYDGDYSADATGEASWNLDKLHQCYKTDAEMFREILEEAYPNQNFENKRWEEKGFCNAMYHALAECHRRKVEEAVREYIEKNGVDNVKNVDWKKEFTLERRQELFKAAVDEFKDCSTAADHYKRMKELRLSTREMGEYSEETWV